MLRREIMLREGESRESYRENSFCGVCLISCHITLPNPLEEVMVGVFIALGLAPKGKFIFYP